MNWYLFYIHNPKVHKNLYEPFKGNIIFNYFFLFFLSEFVLNVWTFTFKKIDSQINRLQKDSLGKSYVKTFVFLSFDLKWTKNRRAEKETNYKKRRYYIPMTRQPLKTSNKTNSCIMTEQKIFVCIDFK